MKERIKDGLVMAAVVVLYAGIWLFGLAVFGVVIYTAVKLALK